MRDGQIERLLGGYATNTLTESERQTLFEAALDDQELFNALQDEQALRDLLEDSSSRQLLERAVRDPEPEAVSHRFGRTASTHAWAWGVAACAAAAGALVFVLGPFGQTSRTTTEVAVLKPQSPLETSTPGTASGNGATKSEPTPKKASPVPAKAGRKLSSPEKRELELAQTKVSDQLASPPAAAPAVALPAAPAGQQSAAQTALVRSETAQRVLPSVTGFAGGAALGGKNTEIPYSVMRRGPDGSFVRLLPSDELEMGNAVRLAVRVPVSGLLNVLEQASSGNWNNIESLPVLAAGQYTVPATPIQINGQTRLRLVLTSGAKGAGTDLRDAAKDALSRPKQRLSSNESATAVPAGAESVPSHNWTTDITLTPGKASNR